MFVLCINKSSSNFKRSKYIFQFLNFVLVFSHLSSLYQCPQCQTSLVKMSSHWENMDNERQRWVLPHQLRDFKVTVGYNCLQYYIL